jgi:hypothetical protein
MGVQHVWQLPQELLVRVTGCWKTGRCGSGGKPMPAAAGCVAAKLGMTKSASVPSD